MLGLVCVFRRKRTQWADAYEGAAIDTDHCPERFIDGIDAWVIQTALRLRDTVPWLTVSLADRPQSGAINLMHRDEVRWWRDMGRPWLVVAQADRPPVALADRVVISPPILQRADNQVYLHHWPQPGIVPRDPTRDNILKNLTFLGRSEHLPRAIRDPVFAAALARLGVRLEMRDRLWHDYSQVDAVIALRADPWRMIATKPASKLVNAWLAGVPALLGPEPAYRAFGRPGKDYLEVGGPVSALAAVAALRADLGLRQRLVAARQVQAQAFTTAAVIRQWLSALAGPLAPDPGRRRSPLHAPLLAVRQAVQTRHWRRPPT